MSEIADTPFPDEVTEPGVNFVSVLLADQSGRWKQNERVPAEEYLRRWPSIATNPEDFYRLILGEIALRQKHGEAPSLVEYCDRFPTHADTLPRLFALIRFCADASPEAIPHPDLPTIPGYELLEEIGQGAVGIVYRAKQTSLGRMVALKVLKPSTSGDTSARARFRAEAESAARLHHPNIVAIFDVGEYQDRPYLAMELMSGASLKERLAKTPLLPRESATLLTQLAAGVEAAHVCGVVHRDLKPANILLQQAVVKIADFGLAKRLDDIGQTRSGDVVGTPAYMAPEQAGASSVSVGPPADIYALGAVLYECLTGRPPFQAATVLETLAQVKSREPVSPRALNPSVPRDLETICLKCLSKEPSQRYARADDFGQDLQRFLEGKPVRARPVGSLARVFRWCKRNQAVAGLLVLVSLLLLGGTGVFFVLWRQARAEAARADKGRQDLLNEQEALHHLVAEQVRLSNESTDGLDENRVQRAAALGQLANFYRERLERDPNDLTSRLMLTDIFHALATLHHAQGRFEEAGHDLLEEIDLIECQRSTEPIKQRCQRVAQTCDALGDSFRGLASIPLAREWHLKAERIWSGMDGELLSEQDRVGQLANRVRLLSLGETTWGQSARARLDTLLDQLSAELFRQQTRPLALTITLLFTWRLHLGESYADYGDISDSARQFQKAIQESERLIDKTAPLHLRCFRGDAYLRLVGRPNVEPYYSEGMRCCEDYQKEAMAYMELHPNDKATLTSMIYNLRVLAHAHQRAGHSDQIAQVYSRVAVLSKRLAAFLSVPGREADLFYECWQEMNDAIDVADLALACEKLHQMIRLLDLMTGGANPSAKDRETRACHLGRLSVSARKAKVPPEEALRYAKESMEIYKELLREAPKNTEYAFGLFEAFEYLGKVYIEQDRDDEAEKAWRAGIAILRPFVAKARDDDTNGYRVRLLRRSLRLAKHLRDRRRLAEAETCLLDQEPLTPEEAPALDELAKEFQELANAVGGGKKDLSAEEKAERSRYQEAADRIQRRAKACR